MGQCGCCDYNAFARFPGPDGTIYAIDVTDTCRDCGGPAGIVIYKMMPEEAEQWGADELPEIDFGELTLAGCVAIAVMDPDILKRHLKKFAKEADPDGDEYDHDGLIDDGVDEVFNGALHESFKHFEQQRREHVGDDDGKW